MPTPTPNDVHVNGLLTNLSVARLQDPSKFVARRVFPNVPVAKKSDIVPTYSAADFHRAEMTRRGPGSKSARSDYRVTTTTTYNCTNWSLEKAVDDQTRANSDAPFRPDQDAAAYLTQQLLLRQEVQFGASFFTTGIWTGSTTGTDLTTGTYTAWDDVTSTPIEDITTEMGYVESKTGFLPNKLVVNRKVWNRLKNHPDIVDRIKGGATAGSPALVTRQAVASLLELDEILVGAAIQNSAQENLTESSGYIFSNNGALLCYAAPAPGLMIESAGYTFSWTGMGGNNAGLMVDTYRDESVKSDIHRIEAAWDEVALSPALGVFFSSMVTS